MSGTDVLVSYPHSAMRTMLHSLLEVRGHTVTVLHPPATTLDVLRTWPLPAVVLFSPLTPEGRLEPLLALLAQEERLARHAYLAVTVESRGLPKVVHTLLIAQAIPLFVLVTDLDALIVEVAQASKRLRIDT
jgi:CheY-like chemotaxis protein